MQGFRVRYAHQGRAMPSPEYWVIKNSVAMKVGYPVKTVGGDGVDIADAVTDKVYGYCVGFRCKNGLPLQSATSGTHYDGTFAAYPYGDSYTAASDNETSDEIAAIVIPALGVVVSAKTSAAIATTTDSNKVGTYFDILTTNALQLDESTATTSKATYISVPGRDAADPTDPNDPITTRILVTVVEHELQDS